MSLATVDTHEVVKDLRSAGFTDAQAEAVARNLRKAQDLDLSTLSTKVDVEQVGTDLRSEIEKVRTDLRSEINKVRTDLRSEIEKVRTDLRSEIEKVRTDLMSEIDKVRTAVADSKAEVIKWVFGAIGFQTLIILGGVIGLIKSLKP